MDSVLSTSSSITVLDELWQRVEDPLSMQRMDNPVTLSCMHILNEDSAIILYGEDCNNPIDTRKPGKDPTCGECRKIVKYWNKDFTVKGLIEKIEQLETVLKTEQAKNMEEISRLKAAERYLNMEVARMNLAQKLHKTVPDSQIHKNNRPVIPEKMMERKQIDYMPDNSMFGSLMLCFGGYGSKEHDKWY